MANAIPKFIIPSFISRNAKNDFLNKKKRSYENDVSSWLATKNCSERSTYQICSPEDEPFDCTPLVDSNNNDLIIIGTPDTSTSNEDTLYYNKRDQANVFKLHNASFDYTSDSEMSILSLNKDNVDKIKKENIDEIMTNNKTNQLQAETVQSSAKNTQSQTLSGEIKKAKRTMEEKMSQTFGEPLSQPDPSSAKIERLKWLQKRRDVGLWVSCDSCNKMRYLADVKDPLELNEFWYCSDHTDNKMNSCEVPEVRPKSHELLDLIENTYNAGSIVWARCSKFDNCWWPAMVDDDPDVEQYYYIEGLSPIPILYHVIYFENGISMCWLEPDDIKPYKTFQPTYTTIQKTLYKPLLKYSQNMADKALKMSIKNRLEKYSFLANWIKNKDLLDNMIYVNTSPMQNKRLLYDADDCISELTNNNKKKKVAKKAGSTRKLKSTKTNKISGNFERRRSTRKIVKII